MIQVREWNRQLEFESHVAGDFKTDLQMGYSC